MRVRIKTDRKPPKSCLRKYLGLWIYFPILFMILLVWVVVWKAGNWLVLGSDFEQASWAVILSGQSRDCERTDATVDLFIEKKIDTLLISSERMFKSRYAGEFLIPDLVQQGIPRDYIFELRHDAYSTLEEAVTIIGQMRLLEQDTVLVVTSNYHSRRTHFIFNTLARGRPYFLIYPAPYNGYDPDSWWSSRQSRKTFFLETVKFCVSWVEVLWRNYKNPLEGPAQTVQIIPDIGFQSRQESGEDNEASYPAGSSPSRKSRLSS